MAHLAKKNPLEDTTLEQIKRGNSVSLLKALIFHYILWVISAVYENSMFSTISKYTQIKTQRDSIVYFQLGSPFVHFLYASDKSYKELGIFWQMRD